MLLTTTLREEMDRVYTTRRRKAEEVHSDAVEKRKKLIKRLRSQNHLSPKPECVKCSYCGARPYEHCSTKRGWRTQPHMARTRLHTDRIHEVHQNDLVKRANDNVLQAQQFVEEAAYQPGVSTEDVRSVSPTEITVIVDIQKSATSPVLQYKPTEVVNVFGITYETRFSEDELAFLAVQGAKVRITYPHTYEARKR